MRIDRDTIAIAVAGTERAGPSGLSVLQDQNIAKINVHAFMNESADGSIIARRIPSEVEIGSEHDHGWCGRESYNPA